MAVCLNALFVGKLKLSRQKRTIWIAWEGHRRTKEICKFLGISPTIFEKTTHRIIKHPFFIIKTVYVLFKEHPHTLIVQNPSIILTNIACLTKCFLKYYLIVDAHNGGIFPDSKIGSRFKFLYLFWIKKADLAIVSNKYLADEVIAKGGRAFILPDKLPEHSVDSPKSLMNDKINILCVCSFESDEPYEEIITATRYCPEGCNFYFTGNYTKLHVNYIKKCPEQVMFTGYLSDSDYWSLLYAVDFVIDLTNRENCLVCGAYEAVSACKPLILSDTRVLREYFFKGALFTENNAQSIKDCIYLMISNLKRLKSEVSDLKIELNHQWLAKGKIFHQIINGE